MEGNRSGTPPGSNVRAGRDVNAANAKFVGRDDHSVTKNTRVRLGPGGLAVVIVPGGGYATYNLTTPSPESVAAERGTDGARHTVEAEVDGDAWRRLATADEHGACTGYMTTAFSSPTSPRGTPEGIVVTGVSGDDHGGPGASATARRQGCGIILGQLTGCR